MRFLAKVCINLAGAIILIVAIAWFIVRGPSTLGVLSMQREITANPGICTHLRAYSQGGQAFSAILSWTDYLRPVVDLIKLSKETSLWEPILVRLNQYRPGSRSVLEAIDNASVKLVNLKQKLDDLGQLSETAQDCQGFVFQPDEKSLVKLGRSAKQSIAHIDSVYTDLAEFKLLARAVAVNGSNLLYGLQTVAQSRTILIDQVAQKAVEVLGPLVTQSNSIVNQVESIDAALTADTETLKKVQANYEAITSWNTWLGQQPFYGIAVITMGVAQDALKLAVVLVGGWAVFSLTAWTFDQSRRDQKTASATFSLDLVGQPPVSWVIHSQPSKRPDATLTWQPHGRSETYDLPPRGQFVIGNDQFSDLVIDDARIQGHPIAIRPARTCFYIENNNSVPILFLNGQYVEKARRLGNRDIIRVGHSLFTINYK